MPVLEANLSTLKRIDVTVSRDIFYRKMEPGCNFSPLVLTINFLESTDHRLNTSPQKPQP